MNITNDAVIKYAFSNHPGDFSNSDTSLSMAWRQYMDYALTNSTPICLMISVSSASKSKQIEMFRLSGPTVDMLVNIGEKCDDCRYKLDLLLKIYADIWVQLSGGYSGPTYDVYKQNKIKFVASLFAFEFWNHYHAFELGLFDLVNYMTQLDLLTSAGQILIASVITALQAQTTNCADVEKAAMILLDILDEVGNKMGCNAILEPIALHPNQAIVRKCFCLLVEREDLQYALCLLQYHFNSVVSPLCQAKWYPNHHTKYNKTSFIRNKRILTALNMQLKSTSKLNRRLAKKIVYILTPDIRALEYLPNFNIPAVTRIIISHVKG